MCSLRVSLIKVTQRNSHISHKKIGVLGNLWRTLHRGTEDAHKNLCTDSIWYTSSIPYNVVLLRCVRERILCNIFAIYSYSYIYILYHYIHPVWLYSISEVLYSMQFKNITRSVRNHTNYLRLPRDC